MTNSRTILALQKLGLDFAPLSCAYNPDSDNLALETANNLNIAPELLLKTLMVKTPDGPIVALIPACEKLDMKKLANEADVKKCQIMNRQEAERLSGYVVGGISPIAQKRTLPTFIELNTKDADVVVCSAGKRGAQIRLKPYDLSTVCRARFAKIT